MARNRRKEGINKGAIWMGVFVIVIMIASSLAFVFNEQQSTTGSLKYNGYNIGVNAQNTRYILEYEKSVYTFFYHPTELAYYEVDQATVPLIKGAEAVYVSVDPEVDVLSLQYQDLLRYDLGQVINKPVIGGVQTSSEAYAFPVITCANATVQAPVLLFNASGTADIVVEGSCIIMNAQGNEVLRMKDLLTYYLLGVMPDGS